MNSWQMFGSAIVLVAALTACPGGNPGGNGNNNPTTATVNFSNPSNVGSFDTTSFTGTSVGLLAWRTVKQRQPSPLALVRVQRLERFQL